MGDGQDVRDSVSGTQVGYRGRITPHCALTGLCGVIESESLRGSGCRINLYPQKAQKEFNACTM